MPFIRVQHNGGAVDTTLNAGIASGDNSLVLTAATGWPDGSVGPFWAVVGLGLPTEEKILVTGRTGTTLTGLTRGADGTSAAAHVAGEIIEHVFTATEADEANQAVHQTLGAVTTKGDLVAATGLNALARLAAGANGLPLVANSAQSTGLNYAALTSAALAAGSVGSTQLAAGSVGSTAIAAGAVGSTQIAAGGVATANIASGAVTNAQIASATIATANYATGSVTRAVLAAALHTTYGSYSGTTDGSNQLVVTHGADFTPSAVLVQGSSPNGGPNQGYPMLIAITATTFTMRFLNTAGSMATQAVTGFYLCLP